MRLTLRGETPKAVAICAIVQPSNFMLTIDCRSGCRRLMSRSVVSLPIARMIDGAMGNWSESSAVRKRRSNGSRQEIPADSADT